VEDGTGFEPDLKYRCPEYPASGDDDGALALHVSLPMHDFKVVSAVDLKYDDLTIGQIPLSIQIPPQTSGILPSALPSRRGQAELPAEVRQINLPKRLGTCGNVGNRQPQICLWRTRPTVRIAASSRAAEVTRCWTAAATIKHAKRG
jgi:hypothetical protein